MTHLLIKIEDLEKRINNYKDYKKSLDISDINNFNLYSALISELETIKISFSKQIDLSEENIEKEGWKKCNLQSAEKFDLSGSELYVEGYSQFLKDLL